MTLLNDLGAIWRTLVIIFTPIVASPILFIDGSKEMSALYGLVIIATYWITEALPLAVTALLPIVIFPLLTVASTSSVTQNYIKNSGLFGFSCITFSLCVEKWNLHRRIALKILLLMGSSTIWLMLGFMIPTWFLSLWVSNTSATAMMLPILTAVLSDLGHIESPIHDPDSTGRCLDDADGEKCDSNESETDKDVLNSVEYGKGQLQRNKDKVRSNVCKALNISICYAATTGGIGSVTGTSTNIIMQGQADELFRKYGLESGVNFLNWMLCCLPIAAICLFLAWAWLVISFFGFRELFKWECNDKETTERTRNVIRAFLNDMGPMTFAEKAVLGHFVALVILWVTMEFPGGGGWINAFPSGYVGSSVPAIVLLTSLFIFPSEWRVKSNKAAPPLMDWRTVQDSFPWNTLMLLGGGYALANTIRDAGLSNWFGHQLSTLSGHHPWSIILLLSVAISFLTEITSNATTASILCPILGELAISFQVHPLYFIFPGALACSLAFMLPVATPPNTLVFATGYLKVSDMMKAGFFLNLLCVGVVNVALNTWISVYFGLDTLPPQMAHSYNTTGSQIMTYSYSNVTHNASVLDLDSISGHVTTSSWSEI